ncbi:Similar to lola: Longitudinals lacking protein [Cotesia congregata]|uniref:Isoforms F/I/K/T (Drosophila melanogaster) n=1 Tax=Cotesia congregata TaxID=51543 RepID=A0A8J2HJ40_COTCN|nr:Similar to lola: Longitudinals lacking protein [Cotesia congregata]
MIAAMKNLSPEWPADQPQIQFPFRCGNCDKRYQHRATLLRHTRYECGKDPRFKCPLCGHRTKQKGNLYKHMRSNHPGEIYYT